MRFDLAFIISNPLFTLLNVNMKLTSTYIILFVCTIFIALISGLALSKPIVATIVVVSVIKFLLVGFQFMELKIAHNFWKYIFVIYSVVIGAIFILLL